MGKNFLCVQIHRTSSISCLYVSFLVEGIPFVGTGIVKGIPWVPDLLLFLPQLEVDLVWRAAYVFSL